MGDLLQLDPDGDDEQHDGDELMNRVTGQTHEESEAWLRTTVTDEEQSTVA